MFSPTREQFVELAAQGNLIPVWREILADMETPVSAFRKIDDGRTSFLLESIEGGEKWARYSFLGSGVRRVFRCKDRYYEILEDGVVAVSGDSDDPLAALQEMMAAYRAVSVPGLPRFFGGAVGYYGYDMVRFVEEIPATRPRAVDVWDACFLITDSLLIFDNVRQTIKVVCNAFAGPGEDAGRVYDRAVTTIRELITRLRQAVPAASDAGRPASELVPNFSKPDFMAAVRRCKEYVAAGDIFQVVLSQRFSGDLGADPFDVYRALRTLNPSPYMFFLRFDDVLVIGASPEVLVRMEEGRVEVRPIAGTRPRGKTPEEDLALEKELLADAKERAEHIMLVDLGRNDIGRVCRIGSVEVSELMVIERYSHVMHIVSNVRGEVEPGRDCFDVLRATFPAGTLSGAPKIRAMEIIEELEPVRREIYGGAVGYFSFSGNMDMAIAIRTLVAKGERIHVQAGAGIVADSDPEMEYQETLNKARSVFRAVEMAREGLD